MEPTRAALVDRAAPGVTIVPERALDETRSVGHVALRDVLVARESVIGPDEYDRAADAFRLALVSGMVGGMDRLVELASEYAKNRHQFGHPIGRFQAVKHRIVDMLVMAELSRALADDAAVAIETGRPDAALAVASAKAYASRAFVSVAASNLQIHGGIGFTWESDCHLYLKRAKTLEHYGGTPSECLERVAAGLGW